MMKQEFEKMAKVEISYEDYENVIEPMYMATEMSKEQFVEFILPSAKKMAKAFAEQKEAERVANQKSVFIGDGTMTPNHCYYMGSWAKLVETKVNVRTGKITYKVREMTEQERRENKWDSYLAYHIDILEDGEAEIKWVA